MAALVGRVGTMRSESDVEATTTANAPTMLVHALGRAWVGPVTDAASTAALEHYCVRADEGGHAQQWTVDRAIRLGHCANNCFWAAIAENLAGKEKGYTLGGWEEREDNGTARQKPTANLHEQ